MLSKQIQVRLFSHKGPSPSGTFITIAPVISTSTATNSCDSTTFCHEDRQTADCRCDNNSTHNFQLKSTQQNNNNVFGSGPSRFNSPKTAFNSAEKRSKRKRRSEEDDDDDFVLSSVPKSQRVAPADRKLRSSTQLRHFSQPIPMDAALEPEADSVIGDFEETRVVQNGRSNQPAEHPPSSCDVVYQDEDLDVQLSQTTRTSPITIQWLLQNYETADGVSLPRQTLYVHYLNHCRQNNVEPANSASFGKLIRSVFLGLKTRRLGTRGNSKYHYYGIRIKADSDLRHIVVDDTSDAEAVESLTNENKRPKMTCALHGSAYEENPDSPTDSSIRIQQPSSSNVTSSTTPDIVQENFRVNNGTFHVPEVTPPNLQQFEANLRLVGLNVRQTDRFFMSYKRHCEEIFDCIKSLSFEDVETCWRNYWQAEEFSLSSDLDTDISGNGYHTHASISRTQLFSLCTLLPVQNYILSMDSKFYEVLINTLIPDVLQPMPGSLTQSIRNFAKYLENGLALALQGAPDVIVKLKLNAVATLAQTLRRYTGLNHLAQAARTVLENSDQISQMLSDLNRIDFRNIQEQACWVCGCEADFIKSVEKSFKMALEKRFSLEQWAFWLTNVVDDFLRLRSEPSCGSMSLEEFLRAGKEFLLKWSFYCSMIMRDLTLRSAISFGSFHLMRLLYDEYMFYLIEQRACKNTGQSVLSIMSTMNKHFAYNNSYAEQYDCSNSGDHHQSQAQTIGMQTIANESPQQISSHESLTDAVQNYQQNHLLQYSTHLLASACQNVESCATLDTDDQNDVSVEEFFMPTLQADQNASDAYDFNARSAADQSEAAVLSENSNSVVRPSIESRDFEPESPDRVVTVIVSNGQIVKTESC